MTDLPTVKLKALVSFPATVLDGTGVDVVANNGTYQFNLAFDDFAPPLAFVDDAANQSTLLWNQLTGVYTLVPVAAFAGAPGSSLPLMDGTAAAGVSTLYSREDHIHPIDTSRAPLASPTFTGDPKAPTPTAGDNDTSVATTAFVTTAIATVSTIPRSYLAGLTLSAAGASATFGVAAGMAVDNSNTAWMPLTSAYTKTTAIWAVGTAAGSLDTGAIALNTWYHVHLMRRPDTGVVDACISLNVATPTTGGAIPAAYTQFRRIGSIKTDGAFQWISFNQQGDEFLWTVCPLDINDATLTTVAKLYALTVPPDLKILAMIRGTVTNAAAAAILLNSPDEPSVATTAASGNVVAVVAAGGQLGDWGILTLRTDTSRQIRAIGNTASTNVRAATVGWLDRRGRDT